MLSNLFTFVKTKVSSLALPANGLGESRATSLSVAHFALQNTKFGSEKGKVQKPARIFTRLWSASLDPSCGREESRTG